MLNPGGRLVHFHVPSSEGVREVSMNTQQNHVYWICQTAVQQQQVVR